jgi:two-component system phosphate regulon sensor histidine kinase PhoR
MPDSMSWLAAATRIGFLVILAALLGGYFGYPWAAVIVTMVLLIAYWLYQMRLIQLWLNDPGQRPPDVYGIWGDLLAQIYQHHRKDREVQEQLQSTVDYLRDSFSSMRDGVVMVDEQGVIKWFNKAAELLLGLRYPDDTGQTLTNLVREPEFNAYFLSADYAVPLQYDTTGDAPSNLRVEITNFDRDSRLLFIRDITTAVRMEQVRRDFVGNVSHELRTPLTVISGYLGSFLVDEQGFSPRYTKALQQMVQQADRMENLLKDLLWLSRIESEEREIKHERVNVRALLQELRDELAAADSPCRLQLQLETDCKVAGDYRELYSAVSNLVTNAVKYSPADSPVTVSWRLHGDKLRLAVTDQGVGIEASHIPRLTERFYRVDDSRSSASGGTGLGLAIVKHVAVAHDARLLIESNQGEGSTFILEFPLRD